jgi:hypothetical protein
MAVGFVGQPARAVGGGAVGLGELFLGELEDDPADNPNGYTFDPSYNYAPVQGVGDLWGCGWLLNDKRLHIFGIIFAFFTLHPFFEIIPIRRRFVDTT